MKIKDVATIFLVNITIFIGLGVVKVWGSETEFIIATISLVFVAIVFLIYYYRKHGTFMKEKNDTK